jgi:hypothetical protein
VCPLRLYGILHEDAVCDVEGGQNLLACLIFIRGDEGMDIDVREFCGTRMRDCLEKNREASRMPGPG